MNRRPERLMTALLLILGLSTFTVLASAVLAQNVSSPKTKAETLLEIARKVNNTLFEAFERLRTRNIPIPQEALAQYNLALVKVNESNELNKAGRYEEASEKAVEGLQQFKESLETIYSQIQEPPTDLEIIVEKIIRLNDLITRALEYVQRVENLTETVETKGFNTTSLRHTIQQAKLLLNKASADLRQRKFESVIGGLAEAKNLMDELVDQLRKVSIMLKAEKLEIYMVESEDRLSSLEEKVISLSHKLTLEAKNASLKALQNARNSLDNAKGFFNKHLLDETAHELMISKEWEEEAVEIVRLNQTASNGTNLNHKAPILQSKLPLQ